MRRDLPVLKVRMIRSNEALIVTGILRRAFNISSAAAARDVKRNILRHPKTKPVTLVASFNGKVIGTVQCHYLKPSRSSGAGKMPGYVIAWLAVEKKSRQQGVGRALVRAAERKIRE